MTAEEEGRGRGITAHLFWALSVSALPDKHDAAEKVSTDGHVCTGSCWGNADEAAAGGSL